MLVTVKVVAPTLARRMGSKNQISLNPGINLLIGPNGSGKSTLLQAIQSSADGRLATSKVDLKLADPRFPLPVFYHAADHTTKAESANDGSNLLSLQSRAESHGQTLVRYLSAIENQVDPAIFLIDEPETALSAEALYEFGQMLTQKVDEGMQFIVATHSPLLMLLPNVNPIVFGRYKNYLRHVISIYRRVLKPRKATS